MTGVFVSMSSAFFHAVIVSETSSKRVLIGDLQLDLNTDIVVQFLTSS